jgi:ATP-dependent helicase/nuclease subunit A
MPSPRHLPDQAARDRVEAALDVNVLVEAGAGSGKTESLARRMAAGIAAGAYQVEGMAAVTFTRKAAAELRGRFQLELERRLREEADAARRARCEAALAGLERLFAGTIHAFCKRLLRERPVEAGVAPRFTELDDLEDDARRGAAWRAWCERERAAGSARFAALAEAGLEPADLEEAFAVVCRFPEVDFPASAAPMPDPAPARRALERFWPRLERLLPRPVPGDTRCEVQKRARELRGRLRVADLSRPFELAAVLARWDGPPRLVRKWWPDPAAVQRLVGAFAEEIAPFLAAWRVHCYGVAVPFLAAARDFAAEARRRAVALNYEDLLQIAARLLRERADVRAALQARYRWLFVDEFQDTDPIQAEVIGLLAAAPAPGRADWLRVPLRPGALFVVGDPKQSIYRFRRADIETYARVRERIEATGGETLALTVSFRARPDLAAWANATFGTFFPPRATREQPAFGRLDAGREAGDPRQTGLRRLVVPAEVKYGEVTARDAGAVAAFVRAEVDAGRRRWGDFLVLACQKRPLAEYERALEALEVPVEVSGAAGFTASPAVRVLATLLRALGDPADEPALVGVLRGPLFGASDVELFRHVQAGLPLRLTLPVPDEAAGPVAEALRRVHEWYRLTRKLPAPAAVERVLEASGWLAAGAAGSPAAAEAGHLLHAVDRVRRIAEAGGTFADAAAALAEALESSEVESVPLESGRRDVVRLMNLHKAKGLEAPVVMLVDPVHGLREQVDVRIVREGGTPRGYLRITRGRGWGGEVVAEPDGWADHEAAELAYVQAERARLLYVAGTRARDLLVVSQWAGTRGRGPWDAFTRFLADAPELRVPDVAAPPAARVRVSAETRAAAAADRAACLAAARTPSWRVESVTGTSHRAAPVGRPVQAGKVREPDTGMAWGTLVHALLEAAGRGPRRDRAHLERLARWLTVDRAELRRVLPEALDTVERVLASDLWERARAADELDAEVPFAVRVPAAAGPPTVMHGVIDLAFRTPAGWSLIDYKTDQADLATLTALYGDQVRQYATHWAALTGIPVAHAGLFAVREDRESNDLR